MTFNDIHGCTGCLLVNTEKRVSLFFDMTKSSEDIQKATGFVCSHIICAVATVHTYNALCCIQVYECVHINTVHVRSTVRVQYLISLGIYVCIWSFLYVYIHNIAPCICTYIHAYMYVHIRTHIHTYVHVCMHTCIHMHLHMYEYNIYDNVLLWSSFFIM